MTSDKKRRKLPDKVVQLSLCRILVCSGNVIEIVTGRFNVQNIIRFQCHIFILSGSDGYFRFFVSYKHLCFSKDPEHSFLINRLFQKPCNILFLHKNIFYVLFGISGDYHYLGITGFLRDTIQIIKSVALAAELYIKHNYISDIIRDDVFIRILHKSEIIFT